MKKETITSIITHIILVVFFFLYLKQTNFEFIGYTIVALSLYWVVFYIYKKTKFPFIVFVGFIIWLFLHMLGGLDINNIRVYGIILIDLIGKPLYILRYDQVVHLYCYFIVGVILYYLARPYLKKETNITLLIVILSATGVGVLNEIIEFLTVLVLGNTGVGDYYNTSLDLVANTIGSTLGVYSARYYTKKNKKK